MDVLTKDAIVVQMMYCLGPDCSELIDPMSYLTVCSNIFSDKPEGHQQMTLSFTFSVREISEVKDSDQVARRREIEKNKMRKREKITEDFIIDVCC